MFRIIDFTLSNCLHSQLRRVSILTQYKSEELSRYVREGWWDLWSNTGTNRDQLVCLPPVSGKRYRGTADAIFQNAEMLYADSEFVLILSGDHIYQMDYRDLVRQHVETNAELTIATVEHPLEEASHFGVVEVDASFRVTGFEEKPANPRPLQTDPARALVSMGVYVFKKSILVNSLRAVCAAGLGYDFGHHIIPTLIHTARTYAYNFRNERKKTPAYWRDIGTIDAYYAASMDLVQQTRRFDPYFNDNQPATPTRHPAPKNTLRARVHSDAYVAQSVLSPGVHIEAGADIDGSILLPGVRVGKGARIRRAIVEEGVELPAGFKVGLDVEHDRKHHTVSQTGVVVIDKTPSNIKPVGLPLVFNSARMRTAKRVHTDAVRATA
jgi:glucose-1-phosphate adenylyltransferase